MHVLILILQILNLILSLFQSYFYVLSCQSQISITVSKVIFGVLSRRPQDEATCMCISISQNRIGKVG